MNKNRYTLKELAASSVYFSIPLYQRLFEWGEEQVIGLMNDLKEHFYKNPHKPYYIGMFTVTKHKNDAGKDMYDLVDGQQRFTVIMLMAIAFDWEDLIGEKDSPRLSLFAREDDSEYLRHLIEAPNPNTLPSGYVNRKMQDALENISNYVREFDEAEKESFIENIKENLTFFMAELPEKYEANDLNKYFETMNSAGKGLENHEILKVKLLKNANAEKQSRCVRIWNLVSQMDKSLIDSDKVKSMFSCGIDKVIESFFDKNKSDTRTDKQDSIKSIQISKECPKHDYAVDGEKSIISFPEFLLLVLALYKEKLGLENEGNSEFFRTDKLLERFECLLKSSGNEIHDFYDELIIYRILFDCFIIRIQKSEAKNSYGMEFKAESDSLEDTNIPDRKKLIQYQSMLYVSTSYYLWLKPILKYLKENWRTVSVTELLTEIKRIDDREIHPFSLIENEVNTVEDESICQDNLSYGKVSRYWFWRLDYYLWEKNLDEDRPDSAISSYTFRTNRSIEHLYPQDDSKQIMKWNDEGKVCNSFGNLALISSSFNSTQSNDSVRVKFARISDQINSGNLESIKMYKMFQVAGGNDNKWTENLAKDHRKEMIKVLDASYKHN